MKKRLPELDIYKANLAIATGLLVLYTFVYPNRYLLYSSMTVGALTLLWPALAQWISWGWYKLAEGLGYVNSRVLLTLVFFGFLLPIATLYRLFNRDMLSLKSGRTDKSLYKERNHTYSANDLKNVW
jgi:hypothetical protein